MKTETQIAEEKLEKLDFYKNNYGEEGLKQTNVWIEGKEHKASCERFLEFLRKMKGRQQRWLTYQLIPLSEKMVDLEQAIKLYNDAGI